MSRKLYEGMFVVDSSKGGSDFPETVRLIAGILQRHDAEIERIEKWDERKFAYPIQRAKRGIYILTYFRAEGSAVAEIREDVALNEDILRVLVLIPEKVTPVSGELYSAEGEEVEPEEVEAEEGSAEGAGGEEAGGEEDAADEEEEEVSAAEAATSEQ